MLYTITMGPVVAIVQTAVEDLLAAFDNASLNNPTNNNMADNDVIDDVDDVSDDVGDDVNELSRLAPAVSQTQNDVPVAAHYDNYVDDDRMRRPTGPVARHHPSYERLHHTVSQVKSSQVK